MSAVPEIAHLQVSVTPRNLRGFRRAFPDAVKDKGITGKPDIRSQTRGGLARTGAVELPADLIAFKFVREGIDQCVNVFFRKRGTDESAKPFFRVWPDELDVLHGYFALPIIRIDSKSRSVGRQHIPPLRNPGRRGGAPGSFQFPTKSPATTSLPFSFLPV